MARTLRAHRLTGRLLLATFAVVGLWCATPLGAQHADHGGMVAAAAAAATGDETGTCTKTATMPTTCSGRDVTTFDDEVSDQCVKHENGMQTPYDYSDPHLYSFVPRWERYSTNATDATTMTFAALPRARTALCLEEVDYAHLTRPYCQRLEQYYKRHTRGLDEVTQFRTMATAMQNPERTLRYLENYPRVTHQAIMAVLGDAPIYSLGHSLGHIKPGDYSPFDTTFSDNIIPRNYIRKVPRPTAVGGTVVDYGLQVMRARLCVEQHMNAQLRLTVYVYHSDARDLPTSVLDSDYTIVPRANNLRLLEVVKNVFIRECTASSKHCKQQQWTPTTTRVKSPFRATTDNDKCGLCKSTFYAEFDHILPTDYAYGSISYAVVGEGQRPHFSMSTMDYALVTEDYNADIKTFALTDASYTEAAAREVSASTLAADAPLTHDTLLHHYAAINVPHNLKYFHVHDIEYQPSFNYGM